MLQIALCAGELHLEPPYVGLDALGHRLVEARRLPDEDARQIKRWKAIRRHVAQVRQNCEPGDLECRKRQRQAVMHWAYDSRKI